MKNNCVILLALILLPATLAACNIPLSTANTTGSSDGAPLLLTGEGQPTRVLLAEAVLTPTVEIAGQFEETGQPVAGTVIKTLTPVNSTEGRLAPPCDLAAPGLPIDVTIQDGTLLQPGEGFSKTWRLVNTGSCTWTSEYALVWFSGQQMNAVLNQPFTREVAPGEQVDITVDMIAPQDGGVYQSYWKLKNPRGDFFGLGPDGDSPFWVKIEVPAVVTASNVATPGLSPTLPVYASGIANLISNDEVDLDTGELNQSGQNDVRYQVDAGGVSQMQPMNGARAAIFSDYLPDERDCQDALLDDEALALKNMTEGIYLCYRTDQGLPGYIYLIQPDPTENLISLDFVTWTVP